MTTDLRNLMLDLPDAAVEGSYSVAAVPDHEAHFVGRNAQGMTCLLVSSNSPGTRTPLRLTGLSVQYSLACAVELAGGAPAHRTLTVLTCTNTGADPERYFLHVMGMLLALLPSNPSMEDIADAIAHVATIFHKVIAPSKSSLIGIVGELVLIAVAADPSAAIDAWRTDVDDRYDFATPHLRLEVKSSGNRQRVHEISYEQCNPPLECSALLASVYVERSAGVLTVEDLVRRI